MPGVNSWNGKWSGEGKKYYAIRKVSDRYLNSSEHFKALRENATDVFSYDFGDGWVANVTLEVIDKEVVNQRKEESAGFAGYDWMIDSIILHGEIRTKLRG